jgi:RIP homotypic interaction motif
MEPISLILAALLAGATKGAGEAAGTAIKDAYVGLRDAVKRKLAARPAAGSAVEEYTADPANWAPALTAYLKQVDADRDEALLSLAQAVMAQADPAGSSSGKYSVDLRGAQGVQVGDGNTQANDFRAGPQTNYFGPGPS